MKSVSVRRRAMKRMKRRSDTSGLWTYCVFSGKWDDVRSMGLHTLISKSRFRIRRKSQLLVAKLEALTQAAERLSE